MLRNYGAASAALALSLFARAAYAFLDPPYITPEHPVEGETISVNVYGGECDILDTGLVPPPITQEGNAIRILFFGAHFENPELCTFGVGTATFPIGAYSAGSYTLQVDRSFPGPGGDLVLETLQVIPFTVVGAATPAPTPSLNWMGFWILVIGLVGAAVRTFVLDERRSSF